MFLGIRMRTAYLSTVIVLALACTTEPNLDEVEAVTTESAYTTPASITVRITNTSSRTLYGAFCPTMIERRVGDTWERTGFERACPAIFSPLVGARTVSTRVVDIPEAMSAGEYRLAVVVYTHEAELIGTLVTRTFQIE